MIIFLLLAVMPLYDVVSLTNIVILSIIGIYTLSDNDTTIQHECSFLYNK